MEKENINRYKPKIRFKGYIDSWEQRKLGSIALNSYGGGTPSTGNDNYWNGTIPWIQSSDLVEDQLYEVKPRKFLTDKGLQNSASKLIPGNSIAIVTRVGVGKLGVLPYPYATSQDFLSLGSLKIDIWFGAYSIYKRLKKDINAVQGTSIKGITKEELLSKDLLIPTLNEQTNIGKLFLSLDNTITLHQRKLKKLQIVTHPLLRKMFPFTIKNCCR